MSERYYFISDVHLGGVPSAEDKLREKRLLAVLDRIELEAKEGTAKALFIVGDLFDSWFEFKSVVPRRHIRTLAKLATIQELIPIEYLMGNHDFGHRDFFQKELHIPVHAGDIERTLLGKKFYIAHGDGKALNDKGYLILRKILRNRAALKLYSIVHPDIGIPFAEWVSSGSRGYTDQRDALQKQDGLRIFAEELLRSGKSDYVIMGHRHKPEIHEVMRHSDEPGRYINLGDWIKNNTYGVFDDEGFRLVNA